MQARNRHFLKDGLRAGLIIFGIILFLSLLGLPLTLGSSVISVFGVAVALLTLVFIRDRIEHAYSATEVVINGLVVGVMTGIGMAIVTLLFANLQAAGVQINDVFAQVLPEHTGALTGLTKEEVRQGVNVTKGLTRLILVLTASGLIGGLLTRLFTAQARERLRRSSDSRIRHLGILSLPFLFFALFLVLKLEGVQIAGSEENIVGLVLLFMFIATSLISLRHAEPGRQKLVFVLSILVIILVLPLPQLTDSFQTVVLNRVAIFIVVGLGLNIVIGYAGLLDIGYVAFFAIGAYSYGMLSAPQSYIMVNVPGFGGINFWVGLPIAIACGMFAGILLGIPVLRLRGDYLAIVTLGFGEIIRLLLLNLRNFTGGPGGVLDIPPPVLFGKDLGDPMGILYLAMFFSAIAAFFAYRLRDSRIGRAWVAVREDETVAQAMGINLVAIKLLAFAMGAAFAGLGGIIYATQQVNIFPDNFTLLVSIDVLSLIIIGGLGSIEGVVLGSVVLIGMPEILRGVDEYRIVAFGALLVTMMIWRPEGLLPSARRQRELHAEDRAQDAWLKPAEKSGTGA